MRDNLVLERLKREARVLLRAVHDGDKTSRARAAAGLGRHVDERFVLADALHVVAREHGASSWPSLVARERRGPIRRGLDDAAATNGPDEVDVETGLSYPDGEPVLITVRRRDGGRYLLSDRGGAVARAGRRHGWLETAERAVRRSGMNVARSGEVFVPAVESRDLEDLAERLARASLDVLGALVELG